MTTYGPTPDGFVLPTAAEIQALIERDQRNALGADLDVSPEQPLGQINGIMAARLRELWELGLAAYSSRSPRSASFQALDALCGLTAVTRVSPKTGKVALQVQLTAGTTLAAGATANVAGQPTNRWVTLADATNSTGSTRWVDVAASAATTGPIQAYASTITEISTPAAGWLAVRNPADAQVGTNLEMDPELRVRREAEIRAGGSSPLSALVQALRAVSGVTDVAVFENATDAPNADGLPGHSIEAVVAGGLEADVANALWAAKAAGIQTVGGVVQSVIDAGGTSRTVRFSRPTLVEVSVYAVVEADRSTYPTLPALTNALVPVTLAAAGTPHIGAPVRIEAFRSALFRTAGVIDVARVTVGRPDGPTDSLVNLALGPRELASYDATRVVVEAR